MQTSRTRASRITPSWRFALITLAAAVTAAVTAALGLWQLDRAAQKQQLFDAIAKQQALAPWHNADVAAQVPAAGQELSDAARQALLHRPAQLQGQWLADETLYLDNRQMQGKVGFYVLTPLRLAPPHEGKVIIVQRGWAPRNFLDRKALPPVQTPAGLVSLRGRLEAPPSRLMELEAGAASADPDGQQSRIRQNADIAAWAGEHRLPLLALTLLQTGAAGEGAAGEGLQRDWPVIDAGVEKHYGYAFQWLVLCVLVVLLYVWFQLVRPRLLASRRHASQ